MNVEKHGAGGVAGIGHVDAAAGEFPEQPSIDGAECESPAAASCARSGTCSRIQEILLAEK